MPHPHPLPVDLSVPALAAWTITAYYGEGAITPSTTAAWAKLDRQVNLAHAVRALLADVARKAAKASPGFVSDSVADAIVSRILGPEVAP